MPNLPPEPSDPIAKPSPTCLVYLPGLDGTGKLLYKQPSLYKTYDLHEISYPQNRFATYEELAEMAVEPLRKAGSGIVLAESFGGAVALTLALKYPDLIQRMVLVNTFAYFPRRFVIQAASWFGRFLPDKPSHPATRGFRSIFFFSKDVPAEDRAEWWNRTGTVPMRAFGYRLRLIEQLDLRSQLSQIHIPTLVLAAPNDRVVSFVAGLDLARRLPRAILVRKRVGHAAMVHPAVDVANLLADRRFWPAPVAVFSP